MPSRVALLLASIGLISFASGQITKPADAPKPLSPEESVKLVKLSDGFRLELIASEPLVHEPSGVCWDERGRMFVCELHGYNLEGQYDIEELNKTGKLDRVVRRIQANDRAKKAAEAETYGTVKRLIDTDGDGRMDKAEVWADRLPPCFGICPARGGIIVVCAPDIVYLADKDGDGKAEVRETLFTGFTTGVLERRMNCPQWGIDNWIYIGRGRGGRITGPNLPKPVDLPATDFRIKADGSAIDPIVGGTGTFGFAMTEDGQRFIVSTGSPGIYVAPLPWRYLARNREVATPRLEHRASTDQRVYPISQPHPWRSKRAEDPGFSKYYTDRYGIAESAPNGYFTSACSPLVYQDEALPELRGHLIACEPAQNLLHRAKVEWNGLTPTLRRVAGELSSEFLASADRWFHPISLSHSPDGSITVVDFYREIIEDYSAIPRYLQQEYGLKDGQNHGRLWRLTHRDSPRPLVADMSNLDSKDLANDLGSPYFWRRQTARRLLIERQDKSIVEDVKQIARRDSVAAALGALYTLKELDALGEGAILAALDHERSSVRVHALRLAEQWLSKSEGVLAKVLARVDDKAPSVLLQLAMSLGECEDKRVLPALARLASERGDQRWMTTAILSSMSGRGGKFLLDLSRTPPASTGNDHSARILEPLCAAIAARRDADELSNVIVSVAQLDELAMQAKCFGGLAERFQNPTHVALSEPARETLKNLLRHEDRRIRELANDLIVGMKVESPAERGARLARASKEAADVKLPLNLRLAAISQLASEDDPNTTTTMLTLFAGGTPQIRKAILSAAFARQSRLPAVVQALEQRGIPRSAISAVQRDALLSHPDKEIRATAARLLKSIKPISDDVLSRFNAALAKPRNLDNGEKVFREKCANCHQAHGTGHVIGPDLQAEFRRAEETIVQDILAPSEKIAAGFATYVIETIDGRVFNGLLAVESAGSITLLAAEGKQQVVLRKDIERIKALEISLMPEELARTLRPQDVADVIAWLRRPASRRVLFDEDSSFVDVLTDGDGTATIVSEHPKSGLVALRVSPPQKYSSQIDGWQFNIREKPAQGEYRFLRFAWKSAGATGVMIELANRGSWPSANSPAFRYYSGKNTTSWQATQVGSKLPRVWTIVTRDLWKDFGDSTITGIAPTAMGGDAVFDQIELLRSLQSAGGQQKK